LPPRDDGEAGERFEGLLPPVSTAPCFSICICKPARRIYGLEDYVFDRIMTETQASALKKTVIDRKNVPRLIPRA
jgi:type IV secretion system protein VirB11